MKKILSLFAALLFVGSMWAAEASIAFSSLYSDNTDVNGTAITIADGITVTFNKGTGSTAPQYYTNGTAVRLYGGNNFVVTSTVGNITKVDISFGEKDGTNAITTNVGSFTSPTWIGNETAVTFTEAGTTGNRRIAGLTITYGEGGDTPDPVDPDPVDPDQPTDNTETVTFDFVSSTYGAGPAYSDANTAYVSKDNVATQDGVSVTFEGSTNNAWRFWNDGIRAYKGKDASFTIEANGQNITAVTWTVKSGATFALDGTSSNITSWTGTETSVKFNYTNTESNLALITLTVTYEKSATIVARPTFEPAATDFVDNVEVTLAAEEGVAIYYTLNGDQPTTSSTLYTAPFTLTETTTVKAIAVKEGVESAVAEKTYTKLQVFTCAEFAALANGESGMLGEVVVTYVNGGNTYLKDETGALLLYASNFGLKAGDVVTGIKGKMSPFNGLPELVPTVALADLTVTSGTAPEPEEMTIVPTTTDLSKYVVFKGVSVAQTTFAAKNDQTTFNVAGADVVLYNQWAFTQTFEADKKYDIVGVVTIYKENIQLYFISATETTTAAVENIETATKVVKTFENGQLVIRVNGNTYNAQGMLLR